MKMKKSTKTSFTNVYIFLNVPQNHLRIECNTKHRRSRERGTGNLKKKSHLSIVSFFFIHTRKTIQQQNIINGVFELSDSSVASLISMSLVFNTSNKQD